MMPRKDNSDKENVYKGNISDRTRSKIALPTPERQKRLRALNQIRKQRATGERQSLQIKFDANLYKSIPEEELAKRELEDQRFIVDDIGDGAYTTDGKGIVDNFQRGKGGEAHSKRFTLAWLKGTQIYMCYGCDTRFREKPNAGRQFVPTPPRDVVLKKKQFREYYDRDTKELSVSTKPSFAYYHISMDCIRKKNPKIDKVCISKHEWFTKLTSSHKKLLEREFGITNYTCEEDH